MTDPTPETSPGGGGFAVAFALTIAGGLLMAASYVADLPTALDAVGATAFLLGIVIILALAFRVARRDNLSVVHALGRGLRTAGRWAVAHFP